MDKKLFESLTQGLYEHRPRESTAPNRRRKPDMASHESSLVPYICGHDHECSDCGDIIKFRKVIYYLGPYKQHWAKACDLCGMKIPRKITPK